MKVYTEIKHIRTVRNLNLQATWGLVPTMGFLHEGHLSLVRRAKEDNDKVGVSIFVNPIQFNNPDDLSTYPRNMDRDLELLQAEGVELVWTPTPEIMYPPDFQTHVAVEKITTRLEGATRLGHFQGVTTVVTKLFNVFQPHRAYFGSKDYQQLITIRQMVADLNMPVEVVACPIVREDDGLAMSSRNANLSEDARQQAVCLYEALCAARDSVANGERNADSVRILMVHMLQRANRARIDYVSVAHPDTLEELTEIRGRVLLSLAVFIDDVRLIDNMVVVIED